MSAAGGGCGVGVRISDERGNISGEYLVGVGESVCVGCASGGGCGMNICDVRFGVGSEIVIDCEGHKS